MTNPIQTLTIAWAELEEATRDFETAFVACVEAGCSDSAIGNVMGCTKQTVRLRRVHRGLEKKQGQRSRRGPFWPPDDIASTEGAE